MSHASRIADQLRMAADDEGLPEGERERLRQRADEITNEDETMTTDNPETETESNDNETEDVPIGAEFDVPLPGMLALDRTDVDGNRMVVIAHRTRRAGDLTIAATGKSIADHNAEWEDEEWAEDLERQPVVDVAFKGNLEERWGDEWQEWPASWLTYKVGNEGMRTYGYPVGRLLFGPEYATVIKEQGRDPARASGADPAEPDVECVECGESWREGETKAEYAVHFDECPECGGDLTGRLVDKEDGDLVTDGGVDLEEARSTTTYGPERLLEKAASNVEHAVLTDVWFEDGEVVVEYEESIGECPACGTRKVGTTAWNSAHDRKYVCPNGDCSVEAHHNEVHREGESEEVIMTDGGTVEKAEPDEELLLTDEGLQMPDMLRGYVGQFHVRTADITGQYNTTESGLPDTDFWDGVLAVYPTDDGDYNPHLGPGLIEVYTTSRAESKVFKIVDKRTDVPEGERQ